MEKHQRLSASIDCVRTAQVLDYSLSSSFATHTPSTSDALRITHEQLRKVYIAEASLLMNMEQCNNLLDLDHIQDSLRRLAVFEAEIQRNLFAHLRLLAP